MNLPPAEITDCETVFDLAKLLNLEIKTLLFFAYNNHKLYTHYKIKKKTGGERKISAPIEALKETCRKLAVEFDDVYNEKMPSSVHGFVDNRSIVTNARNHLSKNYVLNIDLENFFETINTGRVMGLLKAHPFNFNEQLASVLAGIVTHNNSLPQGSPTSPVISNMICRKLDTDLIELARSNNWVYSRYADDITISSNVLTDNLITETKDGIVPGDMIQKIVNKNGFTIKNKKTRLAKPNQSKWVTGVKVNEELNVSRRFVRQVRSMLYSLEKASETINILDDPESIKLLNITRGKISHIGNVKSKENLTFIKLYNRLCELEGKSHKRIPESDTEEYMENVLVIKSSIGFGTGFFIRENIIVTANHVIGSADRNVEITTRGNRLPVEFKGANVIFRDPTNDLAILHTYSSSFSKCIFKVDFSNRNYDHNTDYISIGYGGFRVDKTFWSDVAVVDQKIVQNNSDGYNVDRPMWSGMSGGPIISKTTGQVVGYIVRGSSTLASGQDVKSHVFKSIANVPLEYRPVRENRVILI